jgi:hypothetical protein
MRRAFFCLAVILTACQSTEAPRSINVAGGVSTLTSQDRALIDDVIAEVIARYESGARAADFVVSFAKGPPDTVFVAPGANGLAAPRVYGGVRDEDGDVAIFIEPHLP